MSATSAFERVITDALMRNTADVPETGDVVPMEDEDNEAKHAEIVTWDATTDYEGNSVCSGTRLTVQATYYGWRASVSDGGNAGFITSHESVYKAAELALSGYLAIVNAGRK